MNKRKREPLEEITDEPVKQKEKKHKSPDYIIYTIEQIDQKKSEDFITITFKSWIGYYSYVHFRVKPSVPFKLMMTEYGKCRGMNLKDIRFLSGGKFFHEDETPASLNMEDGDVIDVHRVQN